MKCNEMETQSDFLLPGKLVWSVQMHPVYDAVAEIRALDDGRFQIYHHHGQGSIPWADDINAPASQLEQAIATVKGYQKAFFSNSVRHDKARPANLN